MLVKGVGGLKKESILQRTRRTRDERGEGLGLSQGPRALRPRIPGDTRREEPKMSGLNPTIRPPFTTLGIHRYTNLSMHMN